MKSSLYEIARRFLPEERARSLIVRGINNQKVVGSFSDTKIAATQCITDYFLFAQGGYPYTLDITQFFRLKEIFSKGFALAEEVIAPVIEWTINKNPNSFYKDLFEFYSETLRTENAENLMPTIEDLAKKDSKNSLYLMNNTIMARPKNTPQYDGKSVVITGSNTGIGREIALEFARRGANVVLHHPTAQFSRGALSALELILSSGGCARSYEADFSKTKGIEYFASESFEESVDILVNNAGITFSKAFENISLDELAKVVHVNLYSQFMLSQKAVTVMKQKNRGVIMNMSSNHGIAGKSGHSVYAMTKAGILGLTRELAMEYAKDNIRVNSILPGGVITESHLRLFPNFAEMESNPLSHWNNPADIAKAVCWYCSEEAKNITGKEIFIDCGMSSALTSGRDAIIFPKVEFGRRFIE